jgi:hypothetical protein
MTPQLTKDLFMLQWLLNDGFLAGGSDQVRRSDIRIFVDPDSDAVFEALQRWEAAGFISILLDPRYSKENDVCLRIFKTIEAISEPNDLNEP